MKKAIGAAIIENGKILLVRKNQSWILPGGKPEQGESDIECMCREVQEELSGTLLKNMLYYSSFEGITPHSGEMLRAEVYFADIAGNLGKPSAEIQEARWMSEIHEYNLSDITSKIVNSLQQKGYLPKRGETRKANIFKSS